MMPKYVFSRWGKVKGGTGVSWGEGQGKEEGAG